MRRTAFFLALFVVMVNTLGECSDGKNKYEKRTRLTQEPNLINSKVNG